MPTATETTTRVIPVSKRGGSVKLGDLIAVGTTQFDVSVDSDGVVTMKPQVTISAADLAALVAAAGNGHASAEAETF